MVTIEYEYKKEELDKKDIYVFTYASVNQTEHYIAKYSKYSKGLKSYKNIIKSQNPKNF